MLHLLNFFLIISILTSCVQTSSKVEDKSTSGATSDSDQGSKTVFISSVNGLNITKDDGMSFDIINGTNWLTNSSVNNIYRLNDRLFLSTDQNISISDDNGTTWTNRSVVDGIPTEQYSVFDYDEMQNTVFVGTIGAGLFYSANGGDNFVNLTAAANNLPSDNITDIEIDPNGGDVYLGTDIGIYLNETTDMINGALNYWQIDLSLWAGADANSNIINKINYIGDGDMFVFVSTEKGLFRIKWQVTIDSSYLMTKDVNGIVIDSNGTWFVATNSGVAVSTDSGASFTYKGAAAGLAGTYAKSIAIDANDNLYVTGLAGMSISKNGGNSFSAFTQANGLSNNDTNNIIIVE